MFGSAVFPNSVNIFITNVLNSLFVNCLFLFWYLFSWGFSLAFSVESSSSAFSFCLTFSASMKLGEMVTYCGLEGVSLCGSVHIQSACTQWFWWKSWIWCGYKLCLSSGCVFWRLVDLRLYFLYMVLIFSGKHGTA